MAYISDIVIEGAQVRFLNLEGRRDQYNPNGRRTFCLVISDEELAEQLTNDGWNVKIKPGTDRYEPYKYINCELKFQADSPNVRRDPEVYLVTKNPRGGMNTVRMTAETVGQIDNAQIENVDVDITPYRWSTDNGEGIKAYVRTMYVTIASNVFADKYNTVFVDDESVPF